jgi:hypothetical protein
MSQDVNIEGEAFSLTLVFKSRTHRDNWLRNRGWFKGGLKEDQNLIFIVGEEDSYQDPGQGKLDVVQTEEE